MMESILVTTVKYYKLLSIAIIIAAVIIANQWNISLHSYAEVTCCHPQL